MNEIITNEESALLNNQNIESLIYTIRGKQVMFDKDLAKLYGYDVKYLNRQVQRNIERFPSDFMFQLNINDINDGLRCQIGTLNAKGNKTGMHIKYMPYVFTEQGIYMLATILKGDLAVKQSIYIIRAFKELRHIYMDNNLLLDRIVNTEIKLVEYKEDIDSKLDEVFKYMGNHKEISQKIFFKGQIYDAFSLFVELIESADNEIILIDNYIDIKTLNILAKKNKDVSVNIYTSKKGNSLSQIDVDTFNKEYPSLVVKIIDGFHDRFLLLDKRKLYLIGHSIKDAGNKCFGILEVNDKNIIKDVLNRL